MQELELDILAGIGDIQRNHPSTHPSVGDVLRSLGHPIDQAIPIADHLEADGLIRLLRNAPLRVAWGAAMTPAYLTEAGVRLLLDRGRLQ